MKKGGSPSANEALLLRTSLLDCSNHLSALLLSPELSRPGLRLDGDRFEFGSLLSGEEEESLLPCT